MSQIVLSWTAATAQPGTFIAKYIIYRNDSGNFPPVGTTTTTSFTDTAVLPLTTYQYYVTAIDSRGAVSMISNQVSITSLGPLPAIPTGLLVTGATTTSLTLAWNASSAATSYNLYRNGVVVASTANTFITNSGLNPSTSYTYTVSAVNGGGESQPSSPVTGTTNSTSTQINWNPGFRARTGNAAGDQSTAQNTTTFNFVHGNDVNTQRLKGIYMVYTWNQLEGAQGDYSGGEARIGPMLTLCKNAGYDFSMALNVTGNVNAGGAPAYVIGNTTYGPINLTSGTGSNGGVYQSNGSTLLVRIQNNNVAARLAAMFAHYAAYCAAQGVTLYAIWPTYSEFAFSGGQLTSGWDSDTIINGLMNPGGLADQLRTACPAQKILFSPTFLNSGTDAARWARWQAGIKAYHICNGNYDSTNESGGVASRNYPGDTQFRGTDAAGNALAGCSNLVGVEDSFCHQSEDSLANDPSYWNPVPRARVGDGTLPIVSQHWTQQGVSEVFFASNGYSGPYCNNFNQTFTITGQTVPASYAGVDWQTTGHGGICGYLQKHWPNGPPQRTYPASYP